jgi:flagellar hook assembly protein FlgD
VSPAADAATWFSPNGDGVRDTVALGGTVSERGSVAVHVRDAEGALVRSYSVPTATSIAALIWDGKASGGSVVPDGTYDVRLTPRDAVGNAGEPVTRSVTAIGFLRAVTSSKALFYPQDRDAMSTGTRFSVTLQRAANVTWTIRNASGATVATLLDGVDLPAGTTARNWYALSDGGALLPVGRYTAVVTARDGTYTPTQSVAFEMNAFGIRPSASAATRGRSITLTVTSAESLDRAPRVYVTQPGVSTWAATLTKVSGLTYRVTLRMKTGGRSGTVTFKVQAPDANARYQRTSLSLPLR